jgi:cobalt-zinc-cadmium resistance protein CzcA
MSNGIGSQVQKPLATVVVGGMLVGPVLLLVVVPAVAYLFLRSKNDPKEDGSDLSIHEQHDT